MAAGRGRIATSHRHVLAGACTVALLARSALAVAADAPQVTWLDRIEVTATPIPGTTIDAAQLPYMVQSASNAALSRGRSNNLSDLLQRRFVGVDGNDVQGSAFQNDLTFHGFRASALPGASQGVSVYLDGVRLNEPFADIVSWDMLPEAAISTVTLMPGSNPLFGPNTLGGAVVLSTASGLAAPGLQGEASIGSGARKRLDASYGVASATGWHGFVAVTGFDENGWRAASEGRLGSVFGKVGKQGEQTDWSLSLLHGRSRLIGNGLLPDTRYTDEGPEQGLYRADRRSVYTSPDLTRNRNTLLTAQLDHRFDEDTAVHALAYSRAGRRDTVNGDIGQDYEEFVEECASGYAADGSALDADCDVSRTDAETLHTGALNTTQMRQQAQGVALNLSRQWGAHALTAGVTFDRGHVRYRQFARDGWVQPDRSVVADPATDRAFFSGVRGSTQTLGVFLADTWALDDATHLTAAVRWNHVVVDNILSTADDGDRPRERFVYAKANPSLGLTHRLASAVTLYGSVAQNSRAPTAIELGCADPTQPCRLPTGLQADPRLEQIISRTYELGARWTPSADRNATLSVYRADILFLRAPDTQLGYFDNVGRTRYQGVDAALHLRSGDWQWSAGYSYLDATYRSDGQLLSGERVIALRPGLRIAALPRHNLKLGMEWQRDALTLGVGVRAVSGRVASGNEDGQVDNAEEGEAAPERLDIGTAGYALVDLQARWTINARVSLFARIDNLFDRHYATYAAVAEDVFPDGELARPQDAPVETGPARFLAPGVPRQYLIGLRWAL
ncbi:TonB-dependent receptor [Xanthomonas phaseoli]|uniref:TonB-dependent receptor n=1 Tax=Xanthomonas phaseoli pv. dieffenbachiae TaxID=92828 RepID=A0A1V9HF44_9XANT|nr:TonB-dependent receptor [Xanthomonas phaseoli]MBO9786548.1 TonB-dependent receptor [Xanthomonas phaseoli pv. dieffenbachiae]MBO9887046.1 TonB-dependent receptor [Xanthomonas phaseoli pv. dieffenbachiae]MBO9913017.1 TonB-dependent receptor [Xanthomonas phaseoli pv. dieffenbachiae]MBO9939146.1 TonB-dependent receptor [Xanthomonas phaseoli pv. dieffenbachiae]MBO9993639.1 TonB-dependent receptor [Xanthomonas phaseoli pv. dieffenbachiae]